MSEPGEKLIKLSEQWVRQNTYGEPLSPELLPPVFTPAPIPTYRLTLAFTTPIGTTFHEVAHVEYPGNPQGPGFEDRLIAHFLQDARNFYGEIRVEPVPHFSGPLRLREGRDVKWFE